MSTRMKQTYHIVGGGLLINLTDVLTDPTLFPLSMCGDDKSLINTWGALPNRSSGVDVHNKTRSTSSGWTSAISRAFLAASAARPVKLSVPVVCTCQIEHTLLVTSLLFSQDLCFQDAKD